MQIHKPKILDYESLEVAQNHLASFIVDKINDVNGEKGVVRLGLTGGKSILPIYKDLANTNGLNWEKVHFFLTDERCVKLNDEKSNYFQISQIFGKDRLSEIGEFVKFETDLPTDIALENYTQHLESLEGQFFDLNILSVGNDGHIASLFPNGSYLSHQEKPVIKTKAPNYLDISDRLTLTIESILNSDEIVLFVSGENKSQVVLEMLEGQLSAKEFPAKFLLAHPKLTIFQAVV